MQIVATAPAVIPANAWSRAADGKKVGAREDDEAKEEVDDDGCEETELVAVAGCELPAIEMEVEAAVAIAQRARTGRQRGGAGGQSKIWRPSGKKM